MNTLTLVYYIVAVMEISAYITRACTLQLIRMYICMYIQQTYLCLQHYVSVPRQKLRV